MRKKITFLFIAALCLFASTQQSYAQLTGAAVAPVLSTEANPIYFSIESAAVTSLGTPNSTLTSIIPMKDKGYVLYSPVAAGKINYRIATATDAEKWALVVVSGRTYLKNKSTGLFMRGSHSVGAYWANDSLRVASLGSKQYSLRTSVSEAANSTATNSSYTIAWNSFTCDRWTSATVSTNTAWFFVLDPSATNVPQTISFPTMAVKVVGDVAFSPATASSSLAIAYTSSDDAVASIVGGQVQINGVGTCTITANQAGNANYAAAPQMSKTLTVTTAAGITLINSINAATTQMTSTVAGTNPGQFTTGSRTIFQAAIDAATSVKNEVLSTELDKTTAASTLDAAKVTYLASELAITLSTPGNDTWYYIVSDLRAGKVMVDNAVAGGAVNFTVKDANNNKYWRFVAGTVTPTKVMIQNRASGLYFAATPVVSATAGEYNVVKLGQSQFSFDVSGTPLHAQDNGSVIVTWAGGLGSASAWRLEQVAFTPQTITFPAIDSKTRDAASFDLAATTTASGLAVTYSSSNDLIATVTSTGTVTITATVDGFADITASQAGDAVYAAATPVINRLVVSGITGLASGSSKIAVIAKGNMIVVTGTNAPVKAFTTSGIAVDASKALANGVYVVKVDGLTTKVVIK